MNLLSLRLRDVDASEPSSSTTNTALPLASGPDEASCLAAELFDGAVRAANLTSKEIAHLCGVSLSLVEKWRSTEARGCPSFVQMLLLPVTFHIELHRAMNRRCGFGRAALERLVEDVGDLVLLMPPGGYRPALTPWGEGVE